MTQAAKIDIILPTYNRREFLPRAIGCIRSQTFRDWRLLIVNDGGDDVTDIVSGFGDPRIVCFNRPHTGKAAQLNFALGQATADYIAYMDDDDDVFQEHLEKLLSAAERVGADFVYSDTYLTILDADGRVESRTVENTEDATPENIRLYNRINHKQVLHRRELVERIGGYDEAMRILIDFDGIKRLFGAARRPFHLREITGEHFLRRNARTGEVASISGLWRKDPAAAGRSLLTFFAKDPAALAALYRSVPIYEKDCVRLQAKLNKRLSVRLRKLVRPRSAPSAFHDALPPVAVWREVTPADGILGLFRLADESLAAIAAVNRLAAGDRNPAVARLVRSARNFPPAVSKPSFRVLPADGGVRFVHDPGKPMRWVMLTTAEPLPEDFALEFDYTPYAPFAEQLQFDFRMASFGDRLRFLVRDNAVLVANAVEGGKFLPDGRRVPLEFALGATAHVRIESCGGVHSFSVDGRNLLSLAHEGGVCRRGGYGALVFYEAGPERPVDFEICHLRYFVRT